MKPFNFRVGLIAAGLALTAMPVLAGQRPNESGSPAADRGTAVDRPATSGGPSGSVAGGGGGGGGTAVSGGGGSSVSSSPSGGSAASPSFSSADRGAPMATEPQHRRPSGGEGGNRGGERAVPRSGGSSGSGGSSASGGTTRSGGGTTASSAGGNRSHENHEASDPERAVPSWSRPRGDRPSTGTAVDRTTPPNRGGGGYYNGGRYYYDPFFYGYTPYGFYPGYGLGLGFGFYDPFFDPWGYGGFGYGGYGGGSYYPYDYGAQSYGYATEQAEGAVRLKVKPRDAKVYVDGYFVGTVDNFDGAFQKLKLSGGHHRIEIKAENFETAAFDVLITPDQTVTYQGELKKIR